MDLSSQGGARREHVLFEGHEVPDRGRIGDRRAQSHRPLGQDFNRIPERAVGRVGHQVRRQQIGQLAVRKAVQGALCHQCDVIGPVAGRDVRGEQHDQARQVSGCPPL